MYPSLLLYKMIWDLDKKIQGHRIFYRWLMICYWKDGKHINHRLTFGKVTHPSLFLEKWFSTYWVFAFLFSRTKFALQKEIKKHYYLLNLPQNHRSCTKTMSSNAIQFEENSWKPIWNFEIFTQIILFQYLIRNDICCYFAKMS